MHDLSVYVGRKYYDSICKDFQISEILDDPFKVISIIRSYYEFRFVMELYLNQR